MSYRPNLSCRGVVTDVLEKLRVGRGPGRINGVDISSSRLSPLNEGDSSEIVAGAGMGFSLLKEGSAPETDGGVGVRACWLVLLSERDGPESVDDAGAIPSRPKPTREFVDFTFLEGLN